MHILLAGSNWFTLHFAVCYDRMRLSLRSRRYGDWTLQKLLINIQHCYIAAVVNKMRSSHRCRAFAGKVAAAVAATLSPRSQEFSDSKVINCIASFMLVCARCVSFAVTARFADYSWEYIIMYRCWFCICRKMYLIAAYNTFIEWCGYKSDSVKVLFIRL